MNFIIVENIWADDDGMLQLRFTASNNMQKASQTFYIYPDEISKFSNDLYNFPKNKNDTVSIEYGKSPEFCCYFSFKVVLLDSLGNAAFKFKADNREEAPFTSFSIFYMPCEVATINDFGTKLSKWITKPSEELKYEWKNNNVVT